MLYHLQSFLAQQLNTSWTICKIKCAINITVKQCDFNIHLNKTLTSKFRIRFVSFFFLCESCLFSSQLWWIPGRPEPAKETKIPNIFAACPATETSDDISVPFANCRPNWRHSEYYSCQTDSSMGTHVEGKSFVFDIIKPFHTGFELQLDMR